MRTTPLNTLAITFFIFFGIATSAHAGKIEKKYVFQGDDSARSICLAIAKNNVKTLKRALKAQKFSRLDNNVHERFTCNNQDLFSFAESMKSQLTANYLAPMFGYEENINRVASAAE